MNSTLNMDAKTTSEDKGELDDRQLVKKATGGDQAAYNSLVERYQGKIYALAYNMTGNNADAEDLVQEIFLKAYRYLPRFKQKSSFYTWLYRIAVNHTINFLKKRDRRTFYSLDDVDNNIEKDPDYMELSSRSGPFRDTSLSELQKNLNAAIQKLSDKHRAVVVLHDIQGVPHEEIAKMLNCSHGTVRSRLFYARQQLQSYLKEYAP